MRPHPRSGGIRLADPRGLVNGEIISGENINIASGGAINAVPEPGTALAGVLLLIPLLLGFCRKRGRNAA